MGVAAWVHEYDIVGEVSELRGSSNARKMRVFSHIRLRSLERVLRAKSPVFPETDWHDVAKDGLVNDRVVGSGDEGTAFEEYGASFAVKIVKCCREAELR